MERSFAGYLGDNGSHPNRSRPLSGREIDVLRCYSHGLERPHAADVLGLSPETVKTYAAQAQRKLAAKNVTHAVAIAVRHGLID